MIRKIKLPVLFGVLILLFLGGLVAFQTKNDRLFAIAKSIDIFATLIRELDTYYVDQIDPERLLTVGVEAMLEELDPYTEYIPEEESDDFRMLTTGEYAGVGALIGNRGAGNIVLMPYTGFPAQNAGLRIGDLLLQVDTIEVQKKSTSEVSELLKGPANTGVTVMVKRGEDTLKYSLNRKKISLKNVPFYGKLDQKTGYIKLSDFTTNASAEVRNALVSLKAQGATQLILDLRDNPGGLINEAVEIVNLFIPKGKEVVKTIGKLQQVNYTYKTTKTPVDKEIGVIVLINERSASAAEIVAGALQDYDRAVLLGQKSFGKGLVQTTLPLSFNAQIKVTTAKYYIPSGRCIQAIDYAKSRKDGSTGTVPDSLRKAFKTANGRIVLDGAGIEPDEKVTEKSYAPISYTLVAGNHVFDYATTFFYNNPTIASPSTFEVSEEIYADFKKFLVGKEYDYTTYTEKSVQDMEKFLAKESYFDEVKEQLELIKSKVNHSKENDLDTHKKEIKKILSEEIVSRYYFQEGMIEASLQGDPVIELAKEYFASRARMSKALAESSN
ncbi:MAG: S41 family peptidase [Algoriphagus sp.]|jgi:carboxyl-terminal processing protease|uniref:S41 family peptidase n=3 Tax=Algoriphagus sp. TaxID=1872435 RepID=UPI0027701464|nr:S41 family peptidase [Algoriphagus sp.]MDP4903747.1 S41 family peptidase [Algoriphagus sp.]MDP5124450.1 S41 family peptidase [Algoriphagus sp.]